VQPLPKLRRHKARNLAVVRLSGHDHYLGPWPADQEHPPEAARQAYDQLAAEWLANGRRPIRQAQAEVAVPAFTVADLIVAFWGHVETHYRRADGSATSEVAEYRRTLKAVAELYADLPAAEFSPLKLKAVRQRMVERGVSRGVVNQRVGRVVRLFKWGLTEELVPETVYRSLDAVPGLQAGRTDAPEPEPVQPVAWEVVEKTLPHLNPVVRAMALLMWHTGCRPGEACSIRNDEIDRSGPVWIYRPTHHKTAHRGHARLVAIGRQAQEVLGPFLGRDGFLFSPALAVEIVNAEKRANRKTKVQPSQACRRKARPMKVPGERYATEQYNRAVARACEAAGVGRWHPNQLRHSFATRVRKLHGLEAAQVVLGHRKADVTQVYAERDAALAVKVAGEIG